MIRFVDSRGVRVAAGVAAVAAALLALSQILLPQLAERRLREGLEDNGAVDSVAVRAFPGLKLLWGRADRVDVRMSDARAGAGRFADLVARTADAERVDAEVSGLRILTLRFREVTLRKRGRTVFATATVADADLREALPEGFDVRPVASGAGALVFEGTATLLGRRLRGQAVVAARNGTVVLAPNVLLGNFLSLTIFRDARIDVVSVGARQRPDGFVLTARARLRE